MRARSRRSWRHVGLAAVAVVLVGPFVGCGRDGSSDDGTQLPSEAVVDRCGNDVSDLTTTVRAVDPATGEVRWGTDVPLADSYVLRGASGNPQLPLVRRSVEVELDLATGEVVAYPPAGAHEVLADVVGQTLSVDGEAQPDAPVIGGLTLSTGSGAAPYGLQELTATDASGAIVWRLTLGIGAVPHSVSRPTVFGDLVVVTSSPPAPSCGPTS